MRARIAIKLGNVADATRWASERGLSEYAEVSFLREYDNLTFARLLNAQGDHKRATVLLEALALNASAGGRTGSLIEILMLQAVAHHATGNTVGAMDAIANALELAEPESYLQVFVDEGVPVRELMRLAGARGFAAAYTRRVLAAFESPALVPIARPVELLTQRELEILRLISAGFRNQEIANKLFISQATVKRHIANVYNKLDARHRTEALNRAGALNLL
jgi:LuxR family transcriptional regulator, maltose regulon positive regulatory protein